MFSRLLYAADGTMLCFCQTHRPFQTSSEKCLIDGHVQVRFYWSNTSPVPRKRKKTPLQLTFLGQMMDFWLLCRDSEAFRLNTATVEGSILSWVNSGVAIDLGTDDVSFLRSEHAHLTGSVSVCHLTANHPTMHD